MEEAYRIATPKDSKELAEHLSRNGQPLLPMVELIEGARMAVDELIDVLGRASIEAVLQLSARQLAGEKSQGRKGEEIVWHGSQPGKVRLSDRRLRVRKPRLRRKGAGRGGEVAVPAYEAINGSGRLGSRILEILLCGVSTRDYPRAIAKMAETAGVSKSQVSREFVEESGRKLKELAERRFEGVEFLALYVDGMVFGEHHVIGAVGLDSQGQKRVLGVREGASENAATAVSLLEDLVERGLDPKRRCLFVIDGSKALRSAIDRVFGRGCPVQRCRRHKLANVCGRLPEELAEQAGSVMKAAWRLPWKEGMARLKKQAEWLQGLHPDAAASLREGLEETFTINRLELSPVLRLSLASTNIIESPHSGVRFKTRRVSRWQNSDMVLRWVASAFLDAEKRFRRIRGFRDLWMLRAKLTEEVGLNQQQEVA